ncbi:MAG: ABC transporter permease [Chloroflexi bacterium]|nr:MAG: ABC transporter permease [Chloroflexota bacterium]
MDVGIIWTLAKKELRDALRNRWFALYTLAFVFLALAFSYLALAGAGLTGFAGFGRTAASLINLVLLIVPLMALTIGAQSLAGEQERNTLAYLLAQPISRADIFVGKYVGLALSLFASLTLGFGTAGLVMALNGTGAANPTAYVKLVTLAFLLSLTMLSVGFLVSAITRRAGVAVGIGLFLWLAFVFFGDLGMMGTSMALRVPIANLFWLSLTNPLQVFKMAAILNIQATLDILGPAGLYAMQQYGNTLLLLFLGVLAVWVILPAGLAYLRFATKGEV